MAKVTHLGSFKNGVNQVLNDALKEEHIFENVFILGHTKDGELYMDGKFTAEDMAIAALILQDMVVATIRGSQD